MPDLTGQTIAFLATDGFEQVEFTEPWAAVRDAGATPRLVSLEAGTIHGFNHLDRADEFTVDLVVDDADPKDFDGLVLPGGVSNPDALRIAPAAVAFIRGFFDAGKPVAAICHAPWTLIEADVVRGRRMTSWPSLQTDLRNAGATWTDEAVVVDDELVTSRNPDDLPQFCAAVAERFAAHAPVAR